jgi:hypothetical protein
MVNTADTEPLMFSDNLLQEDYGMAFIEPDPIRPSLLVSSGHGEDPLPQFSLNTLAANASVNANANDVSSSTINSYEGPMMMHDSTRHLRHYQEQQRNQNQQFLAPQQLSMPSWYQPAYHHPNSVFTDDAQSRSEDLRDLLLRCNVKMP